MNQIDYQPTCQFEDNKPSATLTEQQFTLHVADPVRQTPFVQFRGVEYPTLQEASQAITGQVGALFALEILGRTFVLRSEDAVKFLEEKIPFNIGVGNNKTFLSTPGWVQGATDHIHWVDNAEADVTESTASQPVERDEEFDDCVSEVETLISLIQDDVVVERGKEPTDERKRRMDSLRSVLVSGFAIISGMSIVKTEGILTQVRLDHLYQQRALDGIVDWKDIRDEMESIRSGIGDLMDRLGEYGVERVSGQDREGLAKLQVSLNEAHHSILEATP